MTRHVAQKIRFLTIVALVLFFSIATVLASVAALAQVRNTGSASANASADSAPESGAVPAQAGSSLFRLPTSYPAGDVGITEFVAVADLNGDGNPDLVVADQNCAGGCTANGKVSVLLANRAGTGFRPPVVYDSGGQWCSSVAVADVNGDGKPDLVVTNLHGETGGPVGVLLGNGDGTFQPVVTYGSGGQADSIAVADVNGDGKADLIVAFNSTHVEVFLGNGDGTFQTGVPYSASGARSVAVADLNHDGKLDLVVAGSDGGNPSVGIVSVLLGIGDGTFQPAVTYDTGVSAGGWANSVAIADFDGDGKPDLVVANYPDNTVGVLLGKGDGTFQPVTLYDSGASLAASVAAADLNGDGRPDIVVGNSNNGAAVLLGNGDGSFEPALMLNVGTTSVAIADINRDGRPDVVVSNGAAVSVIVNNGSALAATATTVTSDLNPSLFGQSVTFAATVSSTAGTPTGTVIFYDGSTQIRSSALVNGSISMSTSSLHAATHSITAAYQGSSAFAASTSAVLSQVVNSAATTTTLTSSPNPSIGGQTVTFTATVTSASPVTPFGTVIFYDGSTPINQGMLSGGSVSRSTFSLSIGTHSITAVYQGSDSGSFDPSTSAVVTQVVNGPPTTSTALSSSLNPSLFGQTVMFMAMVTSSSGMPTGTVVFYDGSTTIGSATLASGSGAIGLSSLAVGSHSITAAYQGSSAFAPSTSTVLTQVVNCSPCSTSTSLASSLNPSVFGQAVTLTATVKAKSGTPSGTVVFNEGSTSIGSATLANGTATLSVSTLGVGTQSIKAAYQGGSGFASSKSAALKQVVNAATTTTALASSEVPGHVDQTIIYTATVTTQYGGAATGTVTFGDGGATIATVALTGNAAAYATSYTAVGTHSITATYSGDGNNSGSESSVLTEKIFKEPNEPLPSTTTVASSGTPSFVAQPVTFTAIVTSSYGAIPDGELVTFFDDPDHTVKTEIGTGTTTGGVATFTSSSLAPKGHVITATYAGDTKFKTSSGTLVQTVDKYTTTASLVASQNPTNLNEPVTFTVTVTSEGGPTPTGEVDFPGLGTATLNGNGMASITWDAHATCGARGVQAIYEGDAFSNPVKSNAVREIVICTGE